MAILFKRRTRSGNLSKHWWARWKSHLGQWIRRSTGTTIESDAQIIANTWESEDALCRDGHRKYVDRRPISQLLAEYRLKLAAGDNTPRYVDETLGIIGGICESSGILRPKQIRADVVERYIVELHEQGYSARTRQKHLVAINGFTRWLHHSGKLPSNPLAGLKKANPTKDRRHRRRMLLPDE